MHGLINRSIQQFVCDTHGRDTWLAVMRAAEFEFTEFESMMSYPDGHTARLLNAICKELARPRPEIMEDYGAFIVSHRGFEGIRRLLRFGGEDFVDFLHSLDDLEGSVRLAVSDLHVPKVELLVLSEGRFRLRCDAPIPGYGHVMMGVLRTMADDYGALVVLEHLGHHEGTETVSIILAESDFSEGRSFDLAAGLG